MGELLRKSTKYHTIAPVITAGAYSTGDILGTLFEIPGAALDGSGSTILQSIVVTDKSKQDPSFSLVLFSTKPTGTYTNNAPFDPSIADLLKVTLKLDFGGDFTDFTLAAISQQGGLNQQAHSISPDSLNPGKDGSLWAVLVIQSDSVFVTTSDLSFKFLFEQY